jgi:hypothetical protein
MCVFVCVCMRERERESNGKSHSFLYKFPHYYLLSHISLQSYVLHNKSISHKHYAQSRNTKMHPLYGILYLTYSHKNITTRIIDMKQCNKTLLLSVKYINLHSPNLLIINSSLLWQSGSAL